MGFFDVFKKKNRKEENITQELENQELALEPIRGIKKESTKKTIEKKAINFDVPTERKQYLKESCELMLEVSRQIDEAKVEYQAVTSYLTDMQRIDRIPIEEREDIDDAARKIITLTRERSKYQNKKEIKITDVQYKHMEQYEAEIPSEIVKIKKNEDYLIIVKNDMRNLEGEKGALGFKKEEILHQQQYLKGIAIVTSVIVIALFALFVTISSVFYKNMTLPYVLTIIMAAISAYYVFYEARKNRYEMKVTKQKLNKAIGLLNKVKIKYINTTNLIDYSYSKYMVNTSSELKYIWEQYIKAKDEENRYKNNTELLNHYNEILVNRLRDYQIADPDIWIYQAIAIIDNKEMVEVRHRLNVRRQKLRERIDYNSRLRQDSTEQLQGFITKYPDWKSEVIEVLGNYDIQIIN